jgi:hypothetical protein
VQVSRTTRQTHLREHRPKLLTRELVALGVLQDVMLGTEKLLVHLRLAALSLSLFHCPGSVMNPIFFKPERCAEAMAWATRS